MKHTTTQQFLEQKQINCSTVKRVSQISARDIVVYFKNGTNKLIHSTPLKLILK